MLARIHTAIRALQAWARALSPLSLLLAFCSFLALRALIVHGLEPLGVYDEGLLFTNAQMMRDGRVPYRDFYSNYPPGIFQLVRAVIALGVAPIWGMRALTFAVRIMTALAAGWVVGRARAGRFCLATATAVLVLQADLGLAAYAYTYAALLLLVVLALWPVSDRSSWRSIGCGAVFGGVAYLRHDVFVYCGLQLLMLETAWWLARKRSLLFDGARQLGEFSFAAAAMVLALWCPVLVRAGPTRVLHDLLLDPAVLAMPARVLPLPALFDPVSIDALGLSVPGLVGERTRLCLALTAIAILASVCAIVRALISGAPLPRIRPMLVRTAFALATLPQALGRTDYWHVVFGMPLVLTAGFASLDRRVAQLCALLALLPWFAERTPFIGYQDALRLWRSNDELFVTDERAQVAQFLREQTHPGEPIFVGCDTHRRMIANSMDVYYFAHRPGATRYMQFDPGLATGAKAQQEMIADLKRTRPRVVLRQGSCFWDEPNASRIEGASLLDDYLADRYAPSGMVGPFQVWQPK